MNIAKYITLILLFTSWKVQASGISASGPAYLGQTTVYTYSSGFQLIMPNWDAPNGSVSSWVVTTQNGYDYVANITWNVAGFSQVKFINGNNIIVDTEDVNVINPPDTPAVTNTENNIESRQIFVEGMKTMASTNLLNAALYATNIQYFDGLGRLTQDVAWKAGVDAVDDIITPYTYDAFGRQDKQYLSYASNADGAYQNNAVSALTSYRNNPTDIGISNAGSFPYSQTIYDNTPLNRVVKQGAPGSSWQPNNDDSNFTDHTVKQTYGTNAIGSIMRLEADATGAISFKGYYEPGSLRKLTTYDEDNKVSISYTDKLDREVLNRNIDNNEDIETWYIYDVFERLSAVIQPEGTKVIKEQLNSNVSMVNVIVENDNSVIFLTGEEGVINQGSSFNASPGNIVYRTGGSVTLVPGFEYAATGDASFSVSNYDGTINSEGIIGTIDISSTLTNYTFRYKYDYRGRLIEKYVPGGGWTHFIYDKRNRLVFSQDENQRDANKWTFIKYDAFDRAIIRGFHSTTADRAALQSTLDTYYDANTTHYETRVNNGGYYTTSNTFPNNPQDIIQFSFYDNYQFFDDAAYDFNSPYYSTYKAQPIGAQTRSIIIVGNLELTSVMYYDNKGRLIQTVSDNHLSGIDEISLEYSFAGWLTRSKVDHTGAQNVVIEERFTYDHRGRPVDHYHNIDTQGEILLSTNVYNNLGELIEKKLYSDDSGATYAQSVDYRYNVRGWLTTINDPTVSDPAKYFSMQLKYDDAATGYKAYNGNIGGIDWKNPYQTTTDNYKFKYDGMNRLKDADYGTSTSTNSNAYQVNGINYDQNGNIESLIRKGLKTNGTMGTFDNLSYGYLGNRLNKVTDATADTKGFKDGVDQTSEYTYDDNGNMIADANKGIIDIDYNHLNLPTRVDMGSNNYIEYTYTPTGTKLRQKVFENNTLTKTTDYVGGFVYEKLGTGASVLQFVQHASGRLVPNGSSWEYQYHLSDHLGNTRVTFTTEDRITTYDASFEDGNYTVENQHFYNLNDRVAYPNSTVGGKVQKVVGTDIGAGISFAVVPGDELNLSVDGYYNSASGHGAGATNSGTYANSVSSAFGGVNGGTEAQQATYNLFTALGTALLSPGGNSDSKPSAYLNYLVFDKDYVLNTAKSGFVGIGTGVDTKHTMTSPTIDIIEEGFVYIYLSNESSGSGSVYFDNMNVTVNESRIMEKSDYYPFGLTFNAYKKQGLIDQNFKYTGKEQINDLEVNWMDFGARMYDAALGRWHVADAMADKAHGWTPYRYAFNNPIRITDPDGNFEDQDDFHGSSIIDKEKDPPPPRRNTASSKNLEVSSFTIYGGKGGGKVSIGIDNGGKTSKGSKVNMALVLSAQSTIDRADALAESLGDSESDNGEISTTDITLAGVGTAGYIGEKLSKNILNSRSGYTSGKIFENSANNYAKNSARNFRLGGKIFGAGLTLWGVYDTENQFRTGQILQNRRALNHQNNGVGLFFPAYAIPIAIGDYYGQKYSNEINNSVTQPGGFFYETTKYILEKIGIPTKKK